MIIKLNDNEKVNKENLEKDIYIALGNFDGLHKGHMTLINRVIDESILSDAKSMVYTFTNHPLTVADPKRAPKLIMELKQKVDILKVLGIDYIALIDFTMEYMKTSPEDFIKLLMEEYNAKGLVVGTNYRYGYLNKGNIETLKPLCEKLNLKLFVLDLKEDESGVISSSRIRELLQNGDVAKANSLLLEPFMLHGEIIHGKQNGRKLGFPTANLKYSEEVVLPKVGVYYTNVRVKDKLYKGISSVGYNPTIAEGNKLTVETYILNFDEDIYGEEIDLYFIEWLRDEEKYDNLDDLIAQLRIDNNNAMAKEISEDILVK